MKVKSNEVENMRALTILIITGLWFPLGGVNAEPAAPAAPKAATAATATTAAQPETAATTENKPETDEDDEERESRISFGEDLTITAGEIITGDIIVYGGDATVDGVVKGDVVCFGGDIRLGPQAEVEGDVVVAGGTVNAAPGARIGGEKVILGGSSGNLEKFKKLGRLGTEKVGPVKAVVKFTKEVVFFGFLIFVGLLLTVFLPRQFGRVEEHLKDDFPRSALLGVALMVVLPIALLILTVSIIGLPLVPLIILFALAAALAGYVVFARVLGRRILGEGRHAMLHITVGLLLLQGPALIGAALALPGGAFDDVGKVFRIVATVILLTGAFVGMGAVVYSRFGRRTLEETRAAREKKNGSPPGAPVPTGQPT